MEEISFQGEKYVKASLLAKKFGYTSDYVGQLCRAGSIKAQLVGRSWYVEEESLRQHKKSRYRSNLTKTKKELDKSTKQSDPIRSGFGNPRFMQRALKYETDESELLPRIEKGIQAPAINDPSYEENESHQEKQRHVARPADARRPVVRVIRTDTSAAKGNLDKGSSNARKKALKRPMRRSESLPTRYRGDTKEESFTPIQPQTSLFGPFLMIGITLGLFILVFVLFSASSQVELTEGGAVRTSYRLSGDLWRIVLNLVQTIWQ